jgi:glycosyltransferase involved in cell wall biosynthesis
LNIAFVSIESPYSDQSCGIGAYQKAIIPSLVEAGHEVTVFAHATEERSFRAEDGKIQVHHFRLPSLHWYSAKIPGVRSVTPLPLRQLEWSRAFGRQVARATAQKSFDVIESTEAGSLFLNRFAPVVIRLHGSELIFRRHSGIPMNYSVRWNDKLERISCNRAAALTTPSEFQAREIVKHRGWPADRLHVIPNPISDRIVRAAKEFHRNGHSERMVLYTGRLAQVKGIETLLEAAKTVHQNDASVCFVLAGPWQMPEPPAAYGLKLKQESSSRVMWIGPQTQTELIDLYKRAGVFVMPSHYESFGISAVEAMAFDLPLVATDAGALPEVIGGNGRAIMVPKRNPEALAEGIMRALSFTSGKADWRSEANGDCFDDKYLPARVAEQTLELYERVRKLRS